MSDSKERYALEAINEIEHVIASDFWIFLFHGGLPWMCCGGDGSGWNGGCRFGLPPAR